MAAGFSGGDQILKPLDWYRELSRGNKGRNESGYFLVEGSRAIRQVISSRAVLVANAAKVSAQHLLHPPRPPHWGLVSRFRTTPCHTPFRRS